MTLHLGTIIATGVERNDLQVAVVDHGGQPRVALALGPIYAYPRQSGTLTEQLDAVEALGQEIADQVAAHRARLAPELFDAPATPPQRRVAVHLGLATPPREGDVVTWQTYLDAPAAPVTVHCDGDAFEEWGRPAGHGDSIHVVVCCNATFDEVARVASFIAEAEGIDCDPVVTDATDWATEVAA